MTATETTISFPRQEALTRRFRLGLPRGFRVSPDGTRVYASVGATAPSLRALAEGGLGAFPWGQVAVALSLLGVMPWLLRGGVARWQARRSRAEAGSRKEGVG